jgi:Bacteriophage Lambda NinG protein
MTRKFGLNRYGQSERAKAIRKLDAAVSKLIRARDGACITCGRGDVPLDAGHFRRRECMAPRFDYRNVAGQRKKENRFEGGKPYEFGLAIDERFGKGTATRLFKLSKTTKQWEIGELDQLKSAAKHSYLAYTTLYDQLAALSNK